MEHIADEWSERGIRSTFAIKPGASGFRGSRNSCPTGLGWRFSIEHAMGEHSYTFKFDAFLVYKAYLGTLAIPPKDIQIDNMMPIQTDNMVCQLPSGGWQRIGTWLVVDPARRATISFYVSQTCPPGTMEWWGSRVDRSLSIAFPTRATTPPQAPSLPSSPVPNTPAPLETALGDQVLVQSLEEGLGGMVQFVLPYRVSGRHIMATRSVYGSHAVCKALQFDLPEVKERFTAHQHSRNEYDYEADSDISDDEYEDAREDEPQSECPVSPGAAEIAKTLSVSDDLEVLSISSVDWGDDAEGGLNASTPHPESAVVIRQHAYRTWKALLFYQYTGRIALQKLSSLKDPSIPKDVDPLACSPKSMYRIAEKAKLDDLRAACLKAIAADLTEQNIASEVFSAFSSKYSEVLELETDILVKYMRDSDSSCNQEVRRVMQDAAPMPHYGKAIAMIWDKITK